MDGASSPSSSSPPIFSGAAGSPNNTSDPTPSQGNGFNHLWLLFLIPIVLLMVALILATWYVVRRRRKSRQRRSMLRNVTLVVREEEEKRDREEKRLTRGNSIASKLGRSQSLKEARERRFSQKVARAVAKEKKEAGRGRAAGGHQHLSSEDSTEAATTTRGVASNDGHDAAAGGVTAAGAATSLKRSGSTKHRDREVAERVWKISSSDDEEEQAISRSGSKKRRRKYSDRIRSGALAAATLSAAQPERDVEAEAGAARGPTSDSEDFSGAESDQSDSPSSQGHIRPARKREDSNPLSIIGESGLSEGGISREPSRAVSRASVERPRTEEAAAPVGTPASPKSAHAAAAAGAAGVLVPTRKASIKRASSQRSQRSRYTTATTASHYTTAGSAGADDSASMRTAQTGGTITAVPLDAPTAGVTSSASGEDVDPFRSPTSPTSSSHATGSNPFASPTESSAGHGSFATTAAAAAPPIAAAAAAKEAPLAGASGDAASSQGQGGIAGRISSVIRLKQPTPPVKKSNASTASSSTAKGKRSASLSRRGATSSSAESNGGPTSPTAPTSPVATSWAYTPRASEWKKSMQRAPSSSSVPTIQTTRAAAGGEENVPPVPALPASHSSDAVASAGTTTSRPWLDPPRMPSQAKSPPLVRQNSIGVAGSKFKETFDDN